MKQKNLKKEMKDPKKEIKKSRIEAWGWTTRQNPHFIQFEKEISCSL